MTNEELLSVAEIVERATNRFNAQAAYHRERFDEHVKLIASMKADHEAKMVEHRAAFGARTEADAQLITKLRAMVKEQSDSAKAAGELLGWTANESPIQAVERVVRERDGLLTQVQDMRAEIERMRIEAAKCKAERDDLYQREGIEQKRRMDVEDERDGLLTQVQDMRAEMERLRAQMSEPEVSVVGIINERNETWERFWAEVARLKSQTPKQHPVKVGEWVKASNGAVAQVLEVHKDWYLIARGHGWTFANCEPCDPPATHDTEAGKAAAESAVKTEPVTEEIKVGDLGEVFQATTRTLNSDVGITGCVSSIHLDPCHGGFLVKFDPSTQSRMSAGMQAFGLCDVRKVTT